MGTRGVQERYGTSESNQIEHKGPERAIELTDRISRVGEDLRDLDVADDNVALLKDTEANTNES